MTEENAGEISREKKKKKKKRKKNRKQPIGITILKVFLAGLIILAGIALMSFIGIMILRSRGKNELRTDLSASDNQTGITLSGNDIEVSPEDENVIMYNGRLYRPNEDLVTILVMGTDNDEEDDLLSEEDYLHGGQADALFLVILNPHTKEMMLYSINRNAMTEVDVFKADGHYDGRYIKQVALQHGYGDGGEESCLMTVKTVSRMLKNIPINAYVSISMEAVPVLNDAIGGVEVTVPEDAVDKDRGLVFRGGDTINLMGQQALDYVRARDDSFNSNEKRFNRQKQYIIAFAQKAKAMALKDFSVATDLYAIGSEYMVTSVDLDSFTYLATECLGYSINLDNVYSLPGEVIMGETFEEFYIDDSALEGQIIELFYEEVQ